MNAEPQAMWKHALMTFFLIASCSGTAPHADDPTDVPLRAITMDRSIDAPVARVWQAWTDPDDLAKWLAQRATVTAAVGGPYELFWDPEHPDQDSTLGCKLTAVAAEQKLAFTWRGPTQFATLMNQGDPPPTHVVVTFEKQGEAKTLVRIEHLGWGDSSGWEEAMAWQAHAWRRALDELVAYLRAENE